MCYVPFISCNTISGNECGFAMSKARDPMKSHFVMTIWQYNGIPLTDTIDKNSYMDFTDIIGKIQQVVRMCRGHYYCYSIEDSRLKVEQVSPNNPKLQNLTKKIRQKYGEDSVEVGVPPISPVTHEGGLHIHVYMELQRTIRWSTVVNKFQKNGFEGTHVEVRKGWRTTCREYHMGIKNYEEKKDFIISGEWGTWREDLGNSYSKEDYFELAANMIIHGYRPNQVAMRFPSWYIRHGYGVERLYSSLNREKWDNHY
ncbi:MAG: replication-associated protein [Cressdnaviricota sp.]|nr:MAG: replication-associated protein [Cressdnaviricota sp.]